MNENLKSLIKEWNEATDTVLDLGELSLPKVQQLFKETYHVFTEYHNKELVPKEISELILGIEDFLYFANLMEDKEKGIGYYCWEELQYIWKALKNGFFAGKYENAYPTLQIADVIDTRYLLNFETDRIEAYINMVREVAKEPI